MNNKVLFFFPFLFLISISNMATSYAMVPSNVALWTGAGIFISYVVLLKSIATRITIKVSRVQLIFVLLLLGLYLFGLIKSELDATALLIYASSLFFLVLFYSAVIQFENSDNAFFTLLLSVTFLGGLQALIGLVQIYDTYKLLHLWTAYEPFRISGGATGSFQQPNMLASFLSLGLISSFILILEKSKDFSLKLKLSLIISIALMAFVLLSSGSRAALLAFIVPFLLFIIFRFRLILENIKPFLALLFVIGLVWVLQMLINDTSGIDRVFNKVERIAEGGDARIHLYTSAIAMFFDSPWLGYGLGGYQNAFHDFYAGQPLPQGLSQSEYERMTHPHNELLFWMLQSGLVALLGVISFIAFYLKQLFNGVNKNAFYILLVLLPIVIQSMLSYPFGLSALHLFLLILFLALGDNTRADYLTSWHVKRVGVLVSAVFSLLVLYVSFFTFKSIYETYYFFNRMTLYVETDLQKYETQGYFLFASKHPLFNSMASEMMTKLYEKALSDNNLYDLHQYHRWCSNNSLQSSASCKNAKKIITGARYVQEK